MIVTEKGENSSKRVFQLDNGKLGSKSDKNILPTTLSDIL